MSERPPCAPTYTQRTAARKVPANYPLTRSSLSCHSAPATLVTTGAYRYVRHPMGLSLTLLIATEGFLLGMPLVLALAPTYLIIISIYQCCREEPALKERFGDEWDTYASNVGGFCPRCTPWEPSLMQV